MSSPTLPVVLSAISCRGSLKIYSSYHSNNSIPFVVMQVLNFEITGYQGILCEHSLSLKYPAAGDKTPENF